jgi:hypothetical protein
MVTNLVAVSRSSSSVSTEEEVNDLKIKERLVNFILKHQSMTAFREDQLAELGVAKIVGVLIFVVIAMALLPTIITSTRSGVNSSTSGGFASASTLLNLVPLFYAIAILVAVIVWVVHETRGMGEG